MEKQKKYAWQDTNMSLFGSDVEKKIKAAAADGEEQWSDVGQKVELRIWRIEQFKVVEWPRSKHGSFHEGDTYIVLNTYRPEGVLDGTASNPDALAWDIHFWIGEYSTQDEYGTAAYKTVELDCKLEDAAIQHRETMGHESELFRSYFAGGIRLLEGGTETGFTHVEEEVVPVRLFQVKGTAGNLVLREVKKKRDQMNSGDVFVLDTGGTVFVWNGAQANVHEKRQGGEFARGIKSSRSGRAEVTILDEGQSDGDPSSESDEFWKHLPGTRKILGLSVGEIKIKEAGAAGDDEAVKTFAPRLYRIHEGSGLHGGAVRFSRQTMKAGKVPRNSLLSGDVMLLDTGFQVFIWVGTGASDKEKARSFPYAHKYLEDEKRPLVMSVARMLEGKETRKFLEFVGPAIASAGCCVVM